MSGANLRTSGLSRLVAGPHTAVKHFRLSLRTWLLGLSLLATLPLLVFALSVVWEYKEFQQQTLVAQLERHSDELAQVVATELDSTVGTLVALAESDAALAQDVPRLYEHARRVVARDKDIRAISLASAERLLFVTSAPLSKTDFPVNAPGLVAEVLRTQSPNVSGPFPSPVSPIKVVAVTVPVIVNGASTQVLRGILTVESINRLVSAERLPPAWIAAIADRDGVLVARSLDPDLHVGQKGSPSFQEAILRGQRGVSIGQTREGTQILSRVRPVFGLDWYLGVAVPAHVLHEPVAAMLWHVAGLALLWVGLSIALAVVFSVYLARQMQAVAVAMANDTPALPLGIPVRVTELVQMFQRFRLAKHGEAAAKVDLGLVKTAHDEVQDLYDNAPCGYHSLDNTGRVVRMNQTELSWLGLTAEQVLGRRYSDFMTADSHRLFLASFPTFLRDGRISDLAYELVHTSGTTRPVLVSATALLDANGAFLASRSTVFDNTDKRRLEAQLERLANTDALTLLSNRRDFYQKAQQEIARCRRSGGSFSVLMLDVDHFKTVNDRFGHAAGDEVLRQLARQLQDTLRAVDSAARLGGEEFAVLMPESPLDGAQWLAERVRQQLAAASVPWDNGEPIRFTVSVGVAQWQREEDIDATLHRADNALYQAKETGRNRVCVSP